MPDIPYIGIRLVTGSAQAVFNNLPCPELNSIALNYKNVHYYVVLAKNKNSV